jgi:dTDP-4-amino-4,6-dideoxygalactose transaminase
MRDHACERSTGKIKGFGYNSRLDNLAAAILNVKLRHLEGWVNRRREIASRYHEKLSGIRGLTLPPPPANGGTRKDVFQNYVIQTPARDRLVEYLTAKGVETLVSWRIPMHHQEDLGLSSFKLPMTERISREVVSLPMNTEIANRQIDQVIERVAAFFKENPA